MIKKILQILPFVLLLASCGSDSDEGSTSEESGSATVNDNAQDEGKAVLTGTIKNGAGKTIVLERWNQNSQNELVAETVIADDGSFRLVSPIQPLEYYRIFVRPQKSQNDFINVFMRGGETLTMKGDVVNLPGTYTATGNKETEKLVEYLKLIPRGVQRKIDSLRTVSNELPFDATEERQGVLDQVTALRESKAKKIESFIENNIDQPAAFFVTLDKYQVKKFSGEAFSDEDIQQMKSLKAVIQDKMPNSFLVTYADVMINQISGQMADSKFLQQGTEVPNITMPDPDGQMRSLHDLKGKVVLLDFWASWCGPCRRDNPHLVELYNKYHDSGFEVFSVSLDKDKGKWVNAIQADGLTWENHVSDLKFWQSAAAQQFRVQSIPFTILVDREGKIIEKGSAVRGENLDGYLQDIFGF